MFMSVLHGAYSQQHILIVINKVKGLIQVLPYPTLNKQGLRNLFSHCFGVVVFDWHPILAQRCSTKDIASCMAEEDASL